MEKLLNIPVDLNVDASAGGMIDQTNYAGHPRMRAAAREWPLRMLKPIRIQREKVSNLFERWEMIDQGKRNIELYRGHFRAFMPKGKTVLDTNSAHITTDMFPLNERYFIDPSNELAAEQIPKTRLLLDHFVEQSNLQTLVQHMTRSFLKFGTVVVKQWWDAKVSMMPRRVPVLRREEVGELADGQVGRQTMFEPERIIQYEGPKQRVVDLMRWYIHPITAQSVDDYEIIFEEFDVSKEHIMAMARRNRYDKAAAKALLRLQTQLRRGGSEEVVGRRNVRAAVYGYSVDDPMIRDNRFTVTEVWCFFPIYRFTPHPLTGEKSDMPIPCRMVFGSTGTAEPVLLSLTQNPFLDQRPPYFDARVTTQNDYFYGRGMMETLEYMQYILNAFVNQALDAGNFAMNQALFIDVTKLARRAGNIRLAPNAFIPLRGSPRDVVQPWAPENLAPIAMQMAAMVSAWMEEDAWAPGILRGQQTGKRQSAFETQATRAGASTFIDMSSGNLSRNIMSPMLRHMVHMAELMLSPETYQRITDEAKVPEEFVDYQGVVGDYTTRWATGSTAQRREELELAIMGENFQMQQIQNAIAQVQLMLSQMGVEPASVAGPSQQLGSSTAAPSRAPTPQLGAGQVGTNAPPSFLGGG